MKKLLLPFFFTGTVVMMVIMAKTGAPLKTAATPHGILDLEFAYNLSKVSTVIDAWKPGIFETCGINCDAVFNTYLDFIFIFFYAGFFFLTCKKIAVNTNGLVAKAGKLVARFALLAGFFDIFENTGMLLTLGGHVSTGIAFLTVFCSVIKWGLVCIAILYILTGLVALAVQKKSKQNVL